MRSYKIINDSMREVGREGSREGGKEGGNVGGLMGLHNESGLFPPSTHPFIMSSIIKPFFFGRSGGCGG